MLAKAFFKQSALTYKVRLLIGGVGRNKKRTDFYSKVLIDYGIWHRDQLIKGRDLKKDYRVSKNTEDFNLKAVLIIGICQAISLVPGVSRSGITITAARLLNFNRFDSAKISFLLLSLNRS